MARPKSGQKPASQTAGSAKRTGKGKGKAAASKASTTNGSGAPKPQGRPRRWRKGTVAKRKMRAQLKRLDTVFTNTGFKRAFRHGTTMSRVSAQALVAAGQMAQDIMRNIFDSVAMTMRTPPQQRVILKEDTLRTEFYRTVQMKNYGLEIRRNVEEYLTLLAPESQWATRVVKHSQNEAE